MSDETSKETSGASGTENDRLYAGKYKTVDDLETGYRSASSETQRVLQENKNLETKLAERDKTTAVPDEYSIPEAHQALEGLEGIKSKAKELGLTQAQFERYMQGELSQRDRAKQRQDLIRAAAGSDEKLAQVKTYLNNQLGEKLAASVLENMTPEEFHAFAKKAASALDSSRSFGGGISTEKPMSPKEELKAVLSSREYQNGDVNARKERFV